MQAIIDAIACYITWFGLAFAQFFVDAYEWLSDSVVSILQLGVDYVIDVISSWDVTPILDATSYWNYLPSTAINVLGAIGLHYAMSIVISALLIRFVLQLIPFVRLGS